MITIQSHGASLKLTMTDIFFPDHQKTGDFAEAYVQVNIDIKGRTDLHSPLIFCLFSGQLFVPSDPTNRAQYDQNWLRNIYDLRSYYDGHCHTFNPDETQSRRQQSRLSLYLGQHSAFQNYPGRMFKQFSVVEFSVF